MVQLLYLFLYFLLFHVPHPVFPYEDICLKRIFMTLSDSLEKQKFIVMSHAVLPADLHTALLP
jgi:hypothetical protein